MEPEQQTQFLGCQAHAPIPPQSKHKAWKHQMQKRGNKDDMEYGVAEKRGSRPEAGQDWVL